MNSKSKNSEDVSYGVIPLRVGERGYSVLLLKHRNGAFWGFPKGHAEGDESPEAAAKRELKEEANLLVDQILDQEPISEQYTYRHRDGYEVKKWVHYYLATICHGKEIVQEGEILEAKWIALEEAQQLLTYDESKRVCQEAIEKLNLRSL